MDINQKLTEELDVKLWQVEAAVKLIDEGNTIPFISRYRKEVTGSLNDEQLRKLHERLTYLRNLEEKKEQVLSSIEEHWWQWKTFTVPTARSGVPAPPWPGKRGWSLWQPSLRCSRRKSR